MGKAGGFLMIIAIIAVTVGLKFYNKSSAHDEAKARLIEVCGGESACVQAVERNFDHCFDSSYSMGGRRTAAKFDLDELVKCLNDASGESYFALSD